MTAMQSINNSYCRWRFEKPDRHCLVGHVHFPFSGLGLSFSLQLEFAIWLIYQPTAEKPSIGSGLPGSPKKSVRRDRCDRCRRYGTRPLRQPVGATEKTRSGEHPSCSARDMEKMRKDRQFHGSRGEFACGQFLADHDSILAAGGESQLEYFVV